MTVSRLIPMRQKMTIFKEENSVWKGTKFFMGDDVIEIDNFQIRKQRLEGYTIFYEDDFTYGHINFTKSILC